MLFFVVFGCGVFGFWLLCFMFLALALVCFTFPGGATDFPSAALRGPV